MDKQTEKKREMLREYRAFDLGGEKKPQLNNTFFFFLIGLVQITSHFHYIFEQHKNQINPNM